MAAWGLLFHQPHSHRGTLIHFHLTAGDKVKVEGFSFRGSLVDRPLPVVGVSGVGENRCFYLKRIFAGEWDWSDPTLANPPFLALLDPLTQSKRKSNRDRACQDLVRCLGSFFQWKLTNLKSTFLDVHVWFDVRDHQWGFGFSNLYWELQNYPLVEGNNEVNDSN